jgi:nucleotide-binding universal stress UspA family protein
MMSVFKKILVPVDGSAPSKAAADLAVRLASDQGADLVFVSVCETARIIAMMSTPAIGADPSIALDAEREACRHALDDAGKLTVSASCKVQSFLDEGVSIDCILQSAENTKADLIVMGSHGRGGLARAVVGSVAEGVMRRAKIPVLILHVAS